MQFRYWRLVSDIRVSTKLLNMEPPRGFWASLWDFICFLPFFIGLLILGFIKGAVLSPFIGIFMLLSNFGLALCLWPVHFIWSNYCIIRSKQIGPVLKLVLCLTVSALLLPWLLIVVFASCIGGFLFGLLAPLFATFKAIDKEKTDKFYHCFVDGTWDIVKESVGYVMDFRDVCYYSYFSIMHDLRTQEPQQGKYEIRLLDLAGAILAGILGIFADFPAISFLAICKSPYMLFKGWFRLFSDCIGREGPFLETVCVPFAGLAIILWPFAVFGAIVASALSSIFLGGYAAVVAYQESSLWMGLRYIVASVSIYDEYTNDVIDLPEGSCIPRPRYRKKKVPSESGLRVNSMSSTSFRDPISGSLLLELKPFELLDDLLRRCRLHGEIMVSEGLITLKDIEDAKSKKDKCEVISIGLPAFCLLQPLLRSAKANCAGILLEDNVTELNSTNSPRDVIYDWFLNPLLIIKDQIKAENLSPGEEEYFGNLVLFHGDPDRLRKLNMSFAPESERKRAELDALARRLRGITKSISRYPTYRRRFIDSMKTITEELGKRNSGTLATTDTADTAAATSEKSQTFLRSKSAFSCFFGQGFPKLKTGGSMRFNESSIRTDRDLDDIV